MNKKIKTRKYRKKPNTKKRRGGKKRTEKIFYSFGRQHTNPDIKGIIHVKVGPTTFEGESKGEYMSNYFSEVAKSFEEDIALMLNGEPKSKTRQKVFTIEYNDNDAPLEEGSEEPIKCKKPKKSDKK
jgi:hypothetical protein